MKANFGIIPPLENPVKDKRVRYQRYAERALQDMHLSIESLNDNMLSQSVIAGLEPTS